MHAVKLTFGILPFELISVGEIDNATLLLEK
jgi:hypothetical protein